MREILFKRFHFNRKNELVATTYWGKIDQDIEPSDSFFTSPSSVTSSVRAVDCQFTGLKDNNGNKIFEGDKFESPVTDFYFYEVYYNEGCFSLRYVLNGTTYNWGKIDRCVQLMNEFKTFEVIGNIHDKQ